MASWSWREERKRSRDDYEIRDGMNYYRNVSFYFIFISQVLLVSREEDGVTQEEEVQVGGGMWKYLPKINLSLLL